MIAVIVTFVRYEGQGHFFKGSTQAESFLFKSDKEGAREKDTEKRRRHTIRILSAIICEQVIPDRDGSASRMQVSLRVNGKLPDRDGSCSFNGKLSKADRFLATIPLGHSGELENKLKHLLPRQQTRRDVLLLGPFQ